ncbi:MAG: ATP-binding protein [Anaerolineales bacterium]
MSIDESLDYTRIYSIADQLPPDVTLVRSRPFHAPHHTICTINSFTDINRMLSFRTHQSGNCRINSKLSISMCICSNGLKP